MIKKKKNIKSIKNREENGILLDGEENNKIYNGNYCVIKDKLECNLNKKKTRENKKKNTQNTHTK